MHTKRDKQGAYIEVPEDDNDFVTLIKKDGKYVRIVRGPAIDALEKYERLSLSSTEPDDDDCW